MNASMQLVLLLMGGMIHSSVQSQSLIIDHDDVTAFDSIPGMYKQAAASQRMLFMDRSVGGNISNYLTCLSTPFESAANSCKRTMHQDPAYNVDPAEVMWEGVWDRSQWRYEFWPDGCSEDVMCFIDYIDDRLDSFDVIGCQFSYLAVTPGAGIADPVNGFFGNQGNANKASTYAAFAAAHPDKKVVWWTTSLARGIGTIESESFNAQMREYAATHDIILFDVADILSHQPSGEPCFDNRDGVIYKDEDHPDDGMSIPAICPHYTTETEGGHLGSVSAGGVRVAKAFWVLMARIAGWDGLTTSTTVPPECIFNIYPNPARHEFFLQAQTENCNPIVSIAVWDQLGRVLLQKDFIQNRNAHDPITVSLDGFPSGMYFILINSGTSIRVERIYIL
jgi:hypothetical protein